MTPQKGSRSRTIAAALLAVTFAAGAAAGVTGDRWLTPRPTLRTRVTNDMSGVLDKLRLTPQQRTQADAIIERSAPRSEEAMIEVADRLRSVSDSLDAELRTILTEGQRAQLDSLKRPPLFMLKRKTPGGPTIDTLFPGRRGATPPSRR